VNLLERTFLDLASREKKLTAEQRDQIEAACARASGEGQVLRPWRAAFVRGFLTRREVDALLERANGKVEDESDEDAGSEAAEISASAGDEGLDYRIGVLALQAGVVSQEQLQRGLAAQKSRRKLDKKTRPLDEVFVDEGLVSPAVMDGIRLLRERLRQQEDHTTTSIMAIAADLRFGQVALDARLVDDKALKKALAEQKRRESAGGRTPGVGDLLVEQGSITREARDLVLELQERRSARPAAPPPTVRAAQDEGDRIGRLLIENRIVDERQVQDALDLQKELRETGIDRRLGDLLVLRGTIDRPTLETVLKTQNVRRKAPAKRRRVLREEILPEHPLTSVFAVFLALILVTAYLAATDGKEVVERGLVSLGERDPEKK
jgi:hypothetical protein